MQAAIDFNRSFIGLKRNPSTDPDALAAAVEARVEELESRAEAIRRGEFATGSVGSVHWLASVRAILQELADRRAQLAEMRGEAAPAAPNIPGEVVAAFVVAGGAKAVASLASRARARLAHVREKADGRRQTLASPHLAFDPTRGLKAQQEAVAIHQKALEDFEAEGAKLEAVLWAFDREFPRAVASAIGGKAEAEEIALAVAELALAEAPAPGQRKTIETELAEIDDQIARLAPFQAKARKGSIAADLEARKATLAAELKRLGQDGSTRAIDDARKAVASASAGDMAAYRSLCETVAKRPRSFRPGLADDLAEAAVVAFRAGDPADWLALAEG